MSDEKYVYIYIYIYCVLCMIIMYTYNLYKLKKNLLTIKSKMIKYINGTFLYYIALLRIV